MVKKDNFSEVLDTILDYVDKLPNPPKDSIKRELQNIREFIVEKRPPNIMIIGRCKAGKSSLINAIFREKVAEVGSVLSETGKAEWYQYQSEKGAIRILDTRGLGDRTKPESANFQDSIDDITAAIDSECPDVILFLCKARDVDSHIAEDIKNIKEIRSFIYSCHNYPIPVISLITQVDQLDPIKIEPPYDNAIKKKNIITAVKAISDSFEEAKIELMKVIPVSAYAEYKDRKMSYNNYWNINVLIEYLIDALPHEAQIELARLSRLAKVQKKIANVIVKATAVICGGIAATPIPVADIFPITTAQIGMVIGIGYISGRALTTETAKEFLVAIGVNVGTAFVLRQAARALIKYVFPGPGNVVSAVMASTATWAIGKAAIAYFIENKSIDEIKKKLDKDRKDIKDSE